MTTNSLAWKIGGEAGSGIKVTGEMWARLCHHLGLNVYGYTEYPSLIRGGHNTYHVFADEQPIRSTTERVELLVALNKETIDLHISEMSPGGVILYDGEQIEINEAEYNVSFVSFFSVPIKRLAIEAAEMDLMKNTVALGASCALVKVEEAMLNAVIEKVFSRKGEKVVALNQKAAKAGYEYVRNHWDKEYEYSLAPREAEASLLLTGNEALSLGALAAGIDYYGAYPMTPASSVLDFMAAYGPDHGVVVRQTEDEIAAINTAIGASLGGVRAMTGTSGGGFSLMVEALGMAGIVETPLVVLESQRPGPSTGMPTWGGQDDLRFVLHASQGEFPRVVLAPGDPEECFYETANAFNLADQYQCPAIILSDKFLSESIAMSPEFNEEKVIIDRGKWATEHELNGPERFKRYKDTKDGVSARPLPGAKGGVFLANSDEHDEYGYSREESEIRNQQNNKRMRKLEHMKQTLPLPRIYGPMSAELTLICWGSVKGPALDSLSLLMKTGIKANVLHIIYMSPFPSEYVEKIIRSSQKTIVIENNVTAQCAGLIREMTGEKVDYTLGKSDGRPFTPEEIMRGVNDLLK